MQKKESNLMGNPLNYSKRKRNADHLQSPTTFESYTNDYDERNLNNRADGQPAIKIPKKRKFANEEEEYCQLSMECFMTHIRWKYVHDKEMITLFKLLHERLIQPNIFNYINHSAKALEQEILKLAKTI